MPNCAKHSCISVASDCLKSLLKEVEIPKATEMYHKKGVYPVEVFVVQF